MSNLKDSLVWKEHVIKLIREGKVNVPTFNADKYKVTKGGQLVMKEKNGK